MDLSGTLVTVVTAGAPRALAISDALAVAGALVVRRATSADLFAGGTDTPPDLWLVADAAPLSQRAVVQALVDRDPEAAVAVLATPGDEDPASAVPRVDAALPVPALVEAIGALSAPRRRVRALEEVVARFTEEARVRRAAFRTVQTGLERLAHDLRTPLHAALGFAANLRDEIEGPVNDAQRQSAERIVQAMQGAESVLEALHGRMTAAMASAGPEAAAAVQRRERPQRTLVSLSALASDTIGLLGDEARRRRVSVTAAIEPGVAVWGSEPLLRQLLANLVANALKFTPEGGVVTLGLALAAAQGADGRRLAELVVEDTGPGVPPDERERIFEHGVRLDRDAGVAGQGIGLSVCKDAVARHGGTIHVEAAPSGGARFVARLPQDRRARPAAGVLVVRGDAGTEALLDALLTDGPEDLAAVSPEESRAFLLAARASKAVVVVPREGSADALDRAVRRMREGGGGEGDE